MKDLNRLIEALQYKDYVLCADILNYDIKPVLVNLKGEK